MTLCSLPLSHTSRYSKFWLNIKYNRAFEDYIKGLERLDYQVQKQDKRRQERKNREVFAELV